MTRTGQLKAVGAVAILAAGLWAWHTWWPGDERAIRRQLDALAETVNADAVEGLATVARAAQIGNYFTDDVIVDLGQGTAPIYGRDTLIGLAARLQPRAAGYTLDFDGIAVDVSPGSGAANVSLAATFTRRNPPTGEQSIDARELQLGMQKVDGAWRIARVTAADTLRRQ